MEEPRDKSFRVLPPSRGFAWLGQSVAILRLQAGRLLFLAVLIGTIVMSVLVAILSINDLVG